MDYKNLKELRNKFGITQEVLAKRLGMSRPTLIKVENGERDLTEQEKQVCDEIFKFAKDEQTDVRINVPEQKIDKFEQVLLYVLQKVGAKPNVGETVLYKLLYFIDFDYYEKFEKQLMGLTYIKNHYGPTPREFKKVIDDMVASGKLEAVKSKYFAKDQRKYLPKVNPDLGELNGNELEMIDSVLERYADKSATQLSEMSHRDMPWKAAKMKQNIEYEHVFYRSEEFSVRDYDPL